MGRYAGISAFVTAQGYGRKWRGLSREQSGAQEMIDAEYRAWMHEMFPDLTIRWEDEEQEVQCEFGGLSSLEVKQDAEESLRWIWDRETGAWEITGGVARAIKKWERIQLGEEEED